MNHSSQMKKNRTFNFLSKHVLSVDISISQSRHSPNKMEEKKLENYNGKKCH